MLFYIFKIFIKFLIVGLFFHSKAAPYKEKLDVNFAVYLRFFDNIFRPIMSIFDSVKPMQIGQNVGLDLKPFILLIIFILLLSI
jgi:hypothetical protein